MAKHPVPKKRTSRARRDSRRAHDYLTPPTLVSCSNCSEMTVPHTVCPSCGYYAGRRVLDID
ncbi:MAG TPA: 50S ribosomal protein L32 [Deinococcales bacterium]|nr:50S ribosomal protein L32 [Deinococcales bacterium]